jgi:hypothetical protein
MRQTEHRTALVRGDHSGPDLDNESDEWGGETIDTNELVGKDRRSRLHHWILAVRISRSNRRMAFNGLGTVVVLCGLAGVLRSVLARIGTAECGRVALM